MTTPSAGAPPAGLLSPAGCARAASEEQSRLRIDAPIAPSRAARVVALDAGAAELVSHVAREPWSVTHFFVCEHVDDGTGRAPTHADDLLLRGIDGGPAVLRDELDHADVMVLVATEDGGAAAASVIGRACAERGTMTAGLVIGEGMEAGDAVAALRPHARVLLPSASQGDLVDLLSALRA